MVLRKKPKKKNSPGKRGLANLDEPRETCIVGGHHGVTIIHRYKDYRAMRAWKKIRLPTPKIRLPKK